MEPAERLKVYQGFAELGRKWTQVMDAKAGFLSALNVALITFVWVWAKLGAESGYIHTLALLGTILASTSLVISLFVILPRTTLKHVFGFELEYMKEYRAVSFYGYVAGNYPLEKTPPFEKHGEFMDAVNAMDEQEFIKEALEQHYTISHVVQKKSDGVVRAGYLWLLAVMVVLVALFAKG